MIDGIRVEGSNLFRGVFSFLSFAVISFFGVGLFCFGVIHDRVEHFGDGWGDYFEDFVFLLFGEFWELFIYLIPDGFVE